MKVGFPVVIIELDDHASGSPSELDKGCTGVCVGLLYKEDAEAYYVASWIIDGEVMSDDTDAHRVLKSAVKRVIRMKEVA